MIPSGQQTCKVCGRPQDEVDFTVAADVPLRSPHFWAVTRLTALSTPPYRRVGLSRTTSPGEPSVVHWQVMMALAAVHADHPDYDPAWAV